MCFLIKSNTWENNSFDEKKKSIHHKVSQRKWQYVQTSVHALYTAYGLKSYRSHFKTIMPEQKYACYHSISLTKSLGLSSLYLQISWLSVGSSVMLMQVWPPPHPPFNHHPPPTPSGWQGIFFLATIYSALSLMVFVQPLCAIGHINICAHIKTSKRWQLHPKYSTHKVNPQRWSVAAQLAGELMTVTCAKRRV